LSLGSSMPAARNTLSRIIVNVDVYVVVHVDVDGFLKPFCFETHYESTPFWNIRW